MAKEKLGFDYDDPIDYAEPPDPDRRLVQDLHAELGLTDGKILVDLDPDERTDYINALVDRFNDEHPADFDQVDDRRAAAESAADAILEPLAQRWNERQPYAVDFSPLNDVVKEKMAEALLNQDPQALDRALEAAEEWGGATGNADNGYYRTGYNGDDLLSYRNLSEAAEQARYNFTGIDPEINQAGYDLLSRSIAANGSRYLGKIVAGRLAFTETMYGPDSPERREAEGDAILHDAFLKHFSGKAAAAGQAHAETDGGANLLEAWTHFRRDIVGESRSIAQALEAVMDDTLDHNPERRAGRSFTAEDPDTAVKFLDTMTNQYWALENFDLRDIMNDLTATFRERQQNPEQYGDHVVEDANLLAHIIDRMGAATQAVNDHPNRLTGEQTVSSLERRERLDFALANPEASRLRRRQQFNDLDRRIRQFARDEEDDELEELDLTRDRDDNWVQRQMPESARIAASAP